MSLSIFLFIFIVHRIAGTCTDSPKSITTVCGTSAPTGAICSGDIIFEDNFDTLSLKKWKHDLTLSGNFHNPFQYYSNNRTNTWVKNGILHIRPTLLADEIGAAALSSGTIDLNSWYPNQLCTNNLNYGCRKTGTPDNILNPVKSARISTVTSFSFKYGKVEIYAKVPAGDWLWPAFWMLPTYNQYSSWPVSGEIDIVETRGNRRFVQNGVNIGIQRITQALHWGPNSKNNKYSLTTFHTQKTEGWNSDFHKYEMLWTPHDITFYIDKQRTGKVTPPPRGFWKLGNFSNSMSNPWNGGDKMAPFDQEFFLIINLACGGTSFFSDLASNRPYAKPWKNWDGTGSLRNFWDAKENWHPTWNPSTDDSHFQIDYIKVYAL